MFFIHGGGYIMGSSATPLYDGAALARRGCVYVAVNYRLGALGCLDLSSLSTPDIPIDSNIFLRDLVWPLRWVRENIGGFGGDPETSPSSVRARSACRRDTAGRSAGRRSVQPSDFGEPGLRTGQYERDRRGDRPQVLRRLGADDAGCRTYVDAGADRRPGQDARTVCWSEPAQDGRRVRGRSHPRRRHPADGPDRGDENGRHTGFR